MASRVCVIGSEQMVIEGDVTDFSCINCSGETIDSGQSGTTRINNGALIVSNSMITAGVLFNGPVKSRVQTKTANFTTGQDADVYICTTLTNIDVILQDHSIIYSFKNTNPVGTTTLAPASGTIDGTPTLVITDKARVVFDGTNWWTI